MQKSFGSFLQKRTFLLSACLLAGCSALPASGPEERDVLKSERTSANQLGFHIVPIDARVTATLAGRAALPEDTLMAMEGAAPAGVIGPGDVLAISIFEIGSGLFAGNASTTAAQPGTAGISTSATRENLPPVAVDGRGFITIPYVGRLHVAGHTPDEVRALIEGGLHSRSQDPQVVVEIQHDIANTVIVEGEVAKPGRVPLTLAQEHVLDAIALAGGPTRPVQDIVVELMRHGAVGTAPLDTVQHDPAANVTLQPLDRLQVVYRPSTYLTFGAEHVAETPFNAPSVSLAEGIARSGGPQDDRADPNAIFLFRYERPEVAQALGLPTGAVPVPVIYHLDMIDTNSYFLATRIPLRDKDVLYVANARTDKFGKFLGLISALFTPAIVARSVQ